MSRTSTAPTTASTRRHRTRPCGAPPGSSGARQRTRGAYEGRLGAQRGARNGREGTVDPRPPALDVRGLVKDFRGHRAVDGLDLHVEAGEVVALLGPNGAGKSTTMKACAGVVRPTAGSVRVAGIDTLTDQIGARRCLGYVPDVGGL